MKSLKDMNLKEKIGQLIVAGFSGHEFNEHARVLIEEYKIGNIILFSRNIKDVRQLYRLNASLYKSILDSTGIMPFVTIDQEGGMVTRIMQDATFFPGNMTLAATKSDHAYMVGKMMGEELASLGINFNLAPVLDVNNNPKNPVIGIRSYSDNPKKVSEFGCAYISGLQGNGIIATAKHFPGHGDTETDSHHQMTIVPHDKERLQSIELVPFKAAIASGLDAIMSAHVLFPAFEENGLPATLSKNVLKGLLRNELGFRGLIISDCMEMKAISDYYTTEKGSLMALEAGIDLLCISHTLEKQVGAARLIEEAVLSGTLAEAIIDEHVQRVLQFKEKIRPIMDAKFIQKDFTTSYTMLLGKANKEYAEQIVDQSLTLVKGIPFTPSGKTLVIASEPFPVSIAEDKFSDRSIINLLEKETKYSDNVYGTYLIESLVTKDQINQIVETSKEYDQVVVCTYNAKAYPAQIELIQALLLNHPQLHVISTRNPYDILEVPGVRNNVCLYEYTPNSVKTIIRYLKGKLKPTGTLPVHLNI